MKVLNVFKTWSAPKIILVCFIFALLGVLWYELELSSRTFESVTLITVVKIGSKICYSIIGISIFYFFSQYVPILVPRKKRKLAILSSVHQKALVIDQIVQGLKMNMGFDHFSDIKDSELFKQRVENINPDKPIDHFQNWHYYLHHVKWQLIDIIRSMTFYNEFLNKDFLHELLLIEKQLLSQHTFSGFKTLAVSNLSYAEIVLQEIFIHNTHLQKLREEEREYYLKDFKKAGELYRNKYYQNN